MGDDETLESFQTQHLLGIGFHECFHPRVYALGDQNLIARGLTA
jgi:hypothetical protein